MPLHDQSFCLSALKWSQDNPHSHICVHIDIHIEWNWKGSFRLDDCLLGDVICNPLDLLWPSFIVLSVQYWGHFSKTHKRQKPSFATFGKLNKQPVTLNNTDIPCELVCMVFPLQAARSCCITAASRSIRKYLHPICP